MVVMLVAVCRVRMLLNFLMTLCLRQNVFRIVVAVIKLL